MKKLLLLFIFLNQFFAFSQNKIAQNVKDFENERVTFKTFSLFTVQNETDGDVEKVVSNATLASVNLEKINQIVAEKNEFITLNIPYNNQTIDVKLYKVNPFAEGFHIDTDKQKNISYEKGVFYRGIIANDYNSVVSFNFFNNECNGIISSVSLSNLVIGKLVKNSNTKDYIIYADEKLKVLNEFECHTKDIENTSSSDSDNLNKSTLSARCVTMYFEIDYNIFTQNGSNTTTTTNWMTSVFNNVQTLYNNDSITIALKSMYIWTTQDPYEGIGSSSSEYLYAFNAQRPVFDGDVGQLVGIDPGGMGGVAVTIDGLCSSDNFSYSDVF